MCRKDEKCTRDRQARGSKLTAMPGKSSYVSESGVQAAASRIVRTGPNLTKPKSRPESDHKVEICGTAGTSTLQKLPHLQSLRLRLLCPRYPAALLVNAESSNLLTPLFDI